MFKRMHIVDGEPVVVIEFDGKEIEVGENEMVSAALLGSGVKHNRITKKREEKRAPYCQMGICFECLVEIDGVPNQQACVTKVREGMKVKRQEGIRIIL